MIKNIPTSEEYETAGIECLIQAYRNICQIDIEELNEDTDRQEIWEYHKIVLKTSIILTHQGIELILKSKITEKSPLLILEQKKSEWKTLPNSEDCEFADLYTISGNELIRTFFAIDDSDQYDNELVNHFEDIRVLRNKMVHGLGNDEISPDNILKMILNSFTLLLGKESFWNSLLNKFYDHPSQLDGEPKYIFDEPEQYNHLSYLELFLGKGELNKHFNIDFKARRYLCPDCTGSEGILASEDGSYVAEYPNFRYTFLEPNEPDSKNVRCIVCNDKFEVERTNCNKKDCKGNVIYSEIEDEEVDEKGQPYDVITKICLTCNEIQ